MSPKKRNRVQSPKSFQRKRTIGEYEITLPEPPHKTEIAGHDLPMKEQRFTPPDQSYVKRLSRIISGNNADNKSWRIGLEDEDVAFVKRELRRRNEGYWFYNNGNIEYITGLHYFYCAYWYLDDGLPFFVDADRDFYYVWDHCEKDPKCYGLVYICDRRSGKTYKGTNIIYEATTKAKNAQSGIQSKTDGDAKKVFRKLVHAWKKLPEFWRPVSSSGSNPKEELRFEEPSRRASANKHFDYQDVLDSFIDYQPSTEEAYDGSKLLRVYHDEIGKKTKIDIRNRWYIVKPCLEVGGKVIGKAYLSSTVEDTDRKGVDVVSKIWDESDPNKRKGDGTTMSGLYRLFKPAQYGFFSCVDEYGYTVVETPEKPYINIYGDEMTIGSREWLRRRRDGVHGNDLNIERRKYPMDINDAFIKDSKGETFPTYKIQEQKEWNATVVSDGIVTGNFVWGNPDTKRGVEFQVDPNGKFNVAWMPPADQRNLIRDTGRFVAPKDPSGGGIGVDPFDHDQTVSGKKSNAAIYGFRSYTPTEMYASNMFVFEYVNRPALSQVFYEDVMKVSMFYGWHALIENQKPWCIQWMKNQGFYGYVKRLQRKDYTKDSTGKWTDGISMAGEAARQYLVDQLNTYIYKFVGSISDKVQIEDLGVSPNDLISDMYGKCSFDHLLNDWLRFDVNNWTEYDATVASGLAIVCAIKDRAKRRQEEEDSKEGREKRPKDFPFPLFDRHGNRIG